MSIDNLFALEDVNLLLKGAGYLPLKDKSELVFVDRVSRMKGTGYANYLYDIPSQGLRFTFYANVSTATWLPSHSMGIEKISTLKEQKKSHAHLCGEASRKYRLPFPVILAIGPEKAALLKGFIPPIPTAQQQRELECGIQRRKAAIAELLGDTLYKALEVQDMGQTNSNRIAHWLGELTDVAAR